MASSVSYEQAERALEIRLSAGALAHSRRVAQSAAELAEVYGVDVEDARLAGLLHDWDRDLSDEALLTEAKALGLNITKVDRQIPYLLHAQTGAASAALALPGLDARIVDAIGRHTVGAQDMSDLDRVVYVADTFEPGRKHARLDPIRDAVGTVSLDELFKISYAASIKRLVERERPIHPDTVAVWNSLVGNRA